MRNSKRALSLIKPLQVKTGITSFDDLREILRASPRHTLLPRDFFDAAMTMLPDHRDVLAGGDWAQIGVWRGGGAIFLRALMQDLNIATDLHLFDTFGRFPVENFERKKDSIFVRELGLLGGAMSASNYRVEVERLFAEEGMDQGVVFHECDITSNAFAAALPELISFLHVDVDFYEPTLSALNHCYDRVIPGGLIVIDDYYLGLLACKEAVDGFMESRGIKANQAIRRFSSYAAVLIKPGL